MNITPVEIYWLTRLDAVGNLFCLLLVVLCMLVVAHVIGGFIAMDAAYENSCKSYGNKTDVKNDEARMRRRFSRATKLGVSAFLIGLVLSFMPTTKQMAAIIVIPKLANSEIVAEMGDATKELIGLARDWMRTLAPVKNQKGETK